MKKNHNVTKKRFPLIGVVVAGTFALMFYSQLCAACYQYVMRMPVSFPSGQTWAILCTPECVLDANSSWCKAIDSYNPPAPTVYYPCFGSSTETGTWCDCETTIYCETCHSGTPSCSGSEVPCATGCSDWDPNATQEYLELTDCIARQCSQS